MEPDTAGFVLAGGKSSRMGEDKALVCLAGKPLAERAVEILRNAGLPASMAGGKRPLAAFAPMIEDLHPGLGPLGGICSALPSTAARWAVFLSVDLPLLPLSLVRYLIQRAKITEMPVILPSVNGFAQTFPSVLDHAALPALETELKSGRRGCFSAFQTAAKSLGHKVAVVPVESLVQCGQISHPLGLPATRWFLNLNTAEDLRRAQVLLETPIT